MTARVFNWGIAATGGIADSFATDLSLLDDARLVAVASRTQARADEFADRHGAAHRHGSYEALASDPDVEIVYVASPHSRHFADTTMFLEAGKHVLCEKPFALNASQARRMIEAARSRGLFLMEAIWSRFLPAYVALREVIGAGTIGNPLMVEASFGFNRPVDQNHRLFDRALGGGALLDLGIYPLQLASMLLGTPDSIAATGHLGDTGVDERVGAVLHHPGGPLALVSATTRSNLPCTGSISGSDGHIWLPAPMHHPSYIDVSRGSDVDRIDATYAGNGLRFEAAEVHRCLRAGLTESPLMALGETLALATSMDTIRGAIGLRYEADP